LLLHNHSLRDGSLDLQPDFQRGSVWSRPKQRLLIDSILRSWPDRDRHARDRRARPGGRPRWPHRVAVHRAEPRGQPGRARVRRRAPRPVRPHARLRLGRRHAVQ
jgi:hypothetical protein